jgi:hypothetical protein
MTMSNLKELNEKRGRLMTEARAALDEITANTDEARAAELEARHDRIMADFDKTEKLFVLNKTNANAIAEALGEKKAVNWTGKRITLFPTQCDAFGKTADCIRVKGAV